MQTVAVIVTYSNRFHLLEKVFYSCLREGVSSFIIVDNNSDKQSKIRLEKLSKKHKDSLFVIWNKENLGSAKGFKQGIIEACKISNCNYIWLLDDDNEPQKEALNVLKDFWIKKPKDVACLLSFRPDREIYKKAIQNNNPNLVLSSKNSFYGFHIYDKIMKFFKKEKRNNVFFGAVAYAPYGGMFFHKSLIKVIGLPNEEFFLYSDDHDWSYRITKANKKIYLLLDSVINDIDQSWGISKEEEKKSVFSRISNGSSFRIYYTIRNRMIFEKKYLVKGKLLYRINRAIFTLLLLCYSKNNKNFKVYQKAILSAKQNKLGKNYENIIN